MFNNSHIVHICCISSDYTKLHNLWKSSCKRCIAKTGLFKFLSIFPLLFSVVFSKTLVSRNIYRAYNALRMPYNNALRVLFGLCSASDMFAEALTDGFAVVMRKRCALLETCLSARYNRILNVFANRWMNQQTSLHV